MALGPFAGRAGDRRECVGERAAAEPAMHDGQVPVLLAATTLDEASSLWSALPE